MQKVSTKFFNENTVKDDESSTYMQRFHSLVDPAGTPIAITDMSGRFSHINQALADLLGYPIEELVGRPFKQFIHPDDRGRVTRLFLKIILLRRQPRTLEFRVINKDKNVLHLWTRPTRVVINEKTVGFQAIIVDVTERKKSEKELEKSKDDYKHTSIFLNEILCKMSDYVWVIDKNYNIKFLNASAIQAYGDRVGKKCYQIVRNRSSPCHKLGIPCEIHEIIDKGKTYFEDVRPATAIDRITHVHARPLTMPDGKKAVISISRDVTEEKKTKEKLEESISILHGTLESTVDGILVVDKNRKITSYNQKWIKMFDIPEAIRASRDYRKLMNHILKIIDNPDKFLKKTEELFANLDMESLDTFKWNNGRIFERYSRPHRFRGNTVGRVVSFRDITEHKRAEEKIRQYSEHLAELVEDKTRELMISERFLKTIIESVPDHLYIKDRESKYIFANQSYCDFKGKSKEEILEGTVYNLYPKKLADIFTDQDRQVFEKGSNLHTSDIPLRDASGSVRRIYTIKVPLKDHGGEVTHLLGITRDITQLKQAEEQFERIFSMSVDMICIADIDGYFRKINPVFEKILGYTQQELLSKPFLEFVHPEDKDTTVNIIKNTLSKGNTVFDFKNRYRCKDDSYKWLSWTAKPVPTEEFVIAIARDITEQKRLEAIKEHFISTVTHELRSPLVSIKAYLDMALAGKLGELSGELKSGLEVVKRNADRLLNLSEDLMDVKRLESGRLQLNIETLDLKEVIRNCVKEMSPLIAEKRQNLDVDCPDKSIIMQGDRDRLSQVLINLLNNANKFTSEEGKISLNMKERKKSVDIIVSDTGIGIRKEDLKKIFKPFATIKKPTHIKGTGLGLSVSKGLVTAHRGRIRVESPGEGKGTTFTVTLMR